MNDDSRLRSARRGSYRLRHGHAPEHSLSSRSSDPRLWLPVDRYPAPHLLRGLLYVAAPMLIFHTLRYEQAIDAVEGSFPLMPLLPCREAFHNTVDWLKQWPVISPALAGMVVVGTEDEWIGRGVFTEVTDALTLRLPVWYLHGQLGVPAEQWMLGERGRRVNPVTFIPWPLVSADVEGRDLRRWARVCVPDPDTLRERLPVYASTETRRRAKRVGIDLQRVRGSGPHRFIRPYDLRHYARAAGLRNPYADAAGVDANRSARREARRLSIDLGDVPGSGPDGHIIGMDVDRYARARGLLPDGQPPSAGRDDV